MLYLQIHTTHHTYMLFEYGGMLYMNLEEIFRQRTAYSMGVCGGLAFIIIGCLNNVIPWSMSLLKQCLIGGICIVTPLELIFGELINRTYEIWHYRTLLLNFVYHLQSYGVLCHWLL